GPPGVLGMRYAAAQKLGPRPIAAALAFRRGLIVRIRRLLWLGWAWSDALPPWTCRGEHPRVLDGVKARRRDAGREPTQKRERIQVHRDRPIGEGALER